MALLNREKQAAVQQLPIGEITPSPHQTRRDFHEEELAALAQSIDRSGLLNPISVRALPQGGYCLIAGERRWRACQMLGWSRIPALVWQKDDAGAAALTLAENLHRSDLHYIEEAEGILRLIAQCGLSQNEAAALLAMSPSALCNKLRLLRLSPAVQQALIENNIPERLARALLQLPDEDLQQRAINLLIDHHSLQYRGLAAGVFPCFVKKIIFPRVGLIFQYPKLMEFFGIYASTFRGNRKAYFGIVNNFLYQR